MKTLEGGKAAFDERGKYMATHNATIERKG